MHGRTTAGGRMTRMLAAAFAGGLALGAGGCSGSTAPAAPSLPATSATVQSAVDRFANGTVDVAPNCGGTPTVDCPGGTAGSPVPVTVTRGPVTIIQTAPQTFTYGADLAIATQSAIPVGYPGLDCSLSINTAAGSSPTVHVAGTAVFSSRSPGGPIDRLDLTAALSGLESADVTLTGGAACDAASIGLPFFTGVVVNAFSNLSSHLCAGSGGPLTTCS